jgi:hypothetical protein
LTDAVQYHTASNTDFYDSTSSKSLTSNLIIETKGVKLERYNFDNTNDGKWRINIKCRPSLWAAYKENEESDFTSRYITSPYTLTFEHEAMEWATTATAVHEYLWQSAARVEKPVDAAGRLREIIRTRQSPRVISPRGLATSQDIREFRARETLRRLIGEEAFRAYLTRGFITVAAKSGRVYQIRPGHAFTKVWDKGKPVQQLCVVLSGDFAPTDSVIMRLILIRSDEQDFWNRANKHMPQARNTTHQPTIDLRPLPQIMAELRAGRTGAFARVA